MMPDFQSGKTIMIGNGGMMILSKPFYSHLSSHRFFYEKRKIATIVLKNTIVVTFRYESASNFKKWFYLFNKILSP